MKSPCYLVTLSLESSDFQTFPKQYVILVPFGALIHTYKEIINKSAKTGSIRECGNVQNLFDSVWKLP